MVSTPAFASLSALAWVIAACVAPVPAASAGSVATTDDAIRLANRLAPEHCEIMMRQPEQLAERITTAGALFLGNGSPTVMGDYVAGPSHTLPTGGAGASFAGLTVDQFQRRTSVVRYDRASLKKSLPAVRQFAAMEGLDAHGRSAEVRLK